MNLSVFDIFKIGIGPSSSHTMGPMRAACQFVRNLDTLGLLEATESIRVELYGSLALTGKGHRTDGAVLQGLEGVEPESIDPDVMASTIARIENSGRLVVGGKRSIAFAPSEQIVFVRDVFLPLHPNGMRFVALAGDGAVLLEDTAYSVGGGFVVRDNCAAPAEDTAAPYPFATGDELLRRCRESKHTIAELVLANERIWRTDEETRAELLRIWRVMQACVTRGFHQTGVLPGVFKVPRRAPKLYRALQEVQTNHALQVMDWVNVWALAVNEENAAGGRVVTAPTNGAAGIVPAVLHYYERFETGADEDGIVRFFAAAGAIAMLYKRNASISGAEMGCQGEVGVACSMAAAGLVSALNGTNEQIENAAEIGMEHNLGLTCDPVGGLVQIPCIERNAMGAVKAINAARLALGGDGSHKVSLDQVIATMRQTGEDMGTRYKETSQGGLAVNVPEC